MRQFAQWIAVLTIALCAPALAQPRDYGPITITFVDETGLNAQTPVVLSMIRAPGMPPEELPRQSIGEDRFGWAVKMPHPAESWIVEPSFVLRIPERKPTAGGALKSDVPPSEIRISFRIRSLYDPPNYVIPLRLFHDTTDQTLQRIEQMGARERLTQVLLLGQLASYRIGVRPQDQRTKRTVALLYDKIFVSFKDDNPETRWPLRFDSDLLNLIQTAFGDRGIDWRYKRFERDFELSETSFWQERERMLPYVLANGRCDLADLLVEYVKTEHALNPRAFEAQGVPDPDEQIAAMEKTIADACTGPLPVSGGAPPS